MQCDVCGTEVEPHHKFCMECGARLPRPAGADLAPPTPPAGALAAPLPRQPTSDAWREGHPMFDPITGRVLAVPPPPEASEPAGYGPDAGTDDPADDLADDPDATSVLPALGEPMTTFAPPDPTPGAGLPWSTYLHETGHEFPSPPVPPAPGSGPATVPAADEYPAWPGTAAPTAPPEPSYDDEPTRVQYPLGPTYTPAPSAPPPLPVPYAATSQMPATYVPWEGEQVRAGLPGRSFRLKPLLGFALLAAAAAVVAIVGDVITVDAPGTPQDGVWMVNDFGTNLAVAALICAAALLIGALAWCAGFRWGAGLAGGAGAGLAGIVVLPLAAAESTFDAVGRGALTRELGYWGLAAAGATGLLVLLLSLARAADDGRAGLDPWVAALGAIATVVAVIGPLIPINGADIDENWTSPVGEDFATIFFIARIVQLGLLLLCGVFGFLLVRRYGLGLAIGGALGVGWLVLTSATEQTDNPIGPAFFNPGALAPTAEPGDLKAHIVTIAGVGLLGFFALVATAMALIDND